MEATEVQFPECTQCKGNLVQLLQIQNFTCQKCLQNDNEILNNLIKKKQKIKNDLDIQKQDIKMYKNKVQKEQNMCLTSAIYMDDNQLSWSINFSGTQIQQSIQQLQRQLKQLQQQEIQINQSKQKFFSKLKQQNQTISQLTKNINSKYIQLKQLTKQQQQIINKNIFQKTLNDRLTSDNLLSFIYTISFEDQVGLVNNQIISENNKNIWIIAQITNVIIKKAIDSYHYSILSVVQIDVNSEHSSGISIQQKAKNHSYSKIKFQKTVSTTQISSSGSTNNVTSQVDIEAFELMGNKQQENIQAITQIQLNQWQKWLPIICQELDSIQQHLVRNYFKGKNMKPPYVISDNGKLIGGVPIGNKKNSKKAIKCILYFLKHIFTLFYYLSQK